MADISDLSLNTKAVERVLELKGTTNQQFRKISSGSKHDTFVSLAGNNEVVSGMSLKDSLSSIESYIVSTRLVSSRLSSYDVSLKEVYKVAEDYKRSLTTLRSSSGSVSGFAGASKGYLDNLETILNKIDATGYVYSGTSPNDQPVKNLQISNLMNNVPSDNYYLGDTVKLSIRISDTQTLIYGITAAEDGIKDLIGSIHRGIIAEQKGDVSGVDDAFDLVSQAIGEINTLRSNTGNNMSVVEDMIERQLTQQQQTAELHTKIMDTDLPTATIILNQDMAALQASLMTFAKLQKLTLVDYI